MANPFCHIELQTADPGRAKEFYGKLFRWQLDDRPMGNHVYTMVKPGEGTNGGIMHKPAPEAPSAWLVYMQVDNVEQTVAQAQKLGATVHVAKTSVPNMGTFAILSDPTGAPFGIWEPAPKP